jgi:hypothetical protein
MDLQNISKNILDTLLSFHFTSAQTPDVFTHLLSQSRTLLVGEGNFSFTKSLIKDKFINPYLLTATSYETEIELNEYAHFNQRELNILGCKTYNGIDATKLEKKFHFGSFNNIVFNFPNIASRTPKYSRNPNFIMLRKFMSSASSILPQKGKVIITLPDSSYYEGAFSPIESAGYARLKFLTTAPFSYNSFPTYLHENTKNKNSSLVNHTKFKTYIFEK